MVFRSLKVSCTSENSSHEQDTRKLHRQKSPCCGTACQKTPELTKKSKMGLTWGWRAAPTAPLRPTQSGPQPWGPAFQRQLQKRKRRNLTFSPPFAFPLSRTTTTPLIKHLRKEKSAAAIKTRGRIENKIQKAAVVEVFGQTGLKELA